MISSTVVGRPTSMVRSTTEPVGTGARIATFELPAGLHSGPISYKLRPGGVQFLVVAPGGHAVLESPIGDAVIAYTLP